MKRMLDAAWRALAYLLMPRVIGLSLLPLLIAGGLAMVLGYFFWESAIAGVRDWLESVSLVEALLSWLDRVVGPGFRTVIGPLVVVVLALPVVVIFSLLSVALLMTPAIVSLVAERRFAALERRRGAGLVRSVLTSLGWSSLALLILVATLPLWFLIPPLLILIPPLVWGWLTAKVMAFDVLAEHASAEERRALLRTHAWPLLIMGVVTGYLGAAPSLLWATGAVMLIMAPVLVPVAIWLYTLVFAFSALWFAHYGLSALEAFRAERAPTHPPAPESPGGVTEPLPLPPT